MRRLGRAARRSALERVPPCGALALVVGRRRSCRFVDELGLRRPRRGQHVLFALLALGLNVVVGWAGLLDLGYVAFYGFGAYAFAMLSSDQFGIHWPTLVAIPVVIVARRCSGLLLGLPSGGCSATTWRS